MSQRTAQLLAIGLLLGLTSTTTSARASLPAQNGEVQPNRVDYAIQASLDGETKILTGALTLQWTNNTGVPTSELQFHLYQNAFSNNRTSYAVEGSPAHKEGEWGWQRVTAVKAAGVDVFDTFIYIDTDPDQVLLLTENEPFVAEDDRTVFKVDLNAPVASGETLEVVIEWTSQIPRVRRRTGYKDEFLLMAQWFPKLGVFEGERGWNCHQFHFNTEFYSDYGTYRVTLDLPEEYTDKVGGSGVQVVNRKHDGNRVEVVFEAPSIADRERADMFGKLPLVHDFAWTGDPKYIKKEYQFKFDEWAMKSDAYQGEITRVEDVFGPNAKLALRDVDVTVLIHPERIDQAERHYEATANCLFFYGLWFGEYPYEHITVVDPVWGDNRAGGMEYPTLFTAGTAMFTTPDMYRPESVTVHEAGHQFWYGLVGNNEFEAAWLDEGFNSFADSEVLIRAYGPQRSTTSYARYPFDGVRAASLPGGGKLGEAINGRKISWNINALSKIPFVKEVARGTVRPLRSSGVTDWWRDQPLLTLTSRTSDPRWGDRASYLGNPDSDPIDRSAWTYVDRSTYRNNSYPRPAIALRSLIGVIGYKDFLIGMRKYAETWRYRHPYPQDFFDTFSEAVGQDLSWYFEDAFRSTKTIDWSVSVRQSRPSDQDGWFQGEDGVFSEFEDPEAAEGEKEAEGEAAEEEDVADEDNSDEGDKSTKPWAVTITLRRKGELCLPLPWRVIYEDGSQEDYMWSREDQLEQSWKKMRAENTKKIKSVILDPDRAYYFDGNMSDNQWYATGDEVAPLRWTERVLNQYGHLLHWYAGIGG
ncbi:MAG: hypothetical protein ACI8X5_003908 [Planctomycetota bacterium]|jgi:hypothetical protein